MTLKELRNSKSLTQKQMAQLLGISLVYYQKIESKTKNPSYNFIKKVKETFNKEVNLENFF